MKRIIIFGITSFLPLVATAKPPVVMSGPNPSLSSSYPTGVSSILTYKLVNNVPSSLPLAIRGVSAPITRTIVANDCKNLLPKGPSTCNIGIEITPSFSQNGVSINQTLEVDYGGRIPLKSLISFEVVQSYAYIAPYPSSQFIYKCALTNNGDFSSCVHANPDFSQQYGKLAFTGDNEIRYAYLTNPTGFVDQCTLKADGSFSNCVATPPSANWQPYGITFATVNNMKYAYIANNDTSTVSKCSVNTNGSLKECEEMSYAQPSYSPYGIAVASTDGTQYIYVADAGPGGLGSTGNIYKCTLNKSNGGLSSCSIAVEDSSTPEWVPYAIAFITVNHSHYAYIADNGQGYPPDYGNIYMCTVGHNGSLHSCTVTPTTNAPQWFPSDLAFAKLNGSQYVYVTSYQSSYGGMFRCKVSSVGSFTDCISTSNSASLTQPVGIAFNFD